MKSKPNRTKSRSAIQIDSSKKSKNPYELCGVSDKELIDFCLNCISNKCSGTCDKLRRYKIKLREEKKSGNT